MKKHGERNTQLDKEKLDTIIGLLRPRKRNYFSNREEPSQEVTFRVENNSELRYVISCLLRVSMMALEFEGTLSSSRLPYISKELAVTTILELIDNILPDDQLDSYDKIEELLLSDCEKK